MTKTKNISCVEYYYYVLEAKLAGNEDIVISIAAEFCDNSKKNREAAGNSKSEKEETKQDCALKACYRLMENLKKGFPPFDRSYCRTFMHAPVGQGNTERSWKQDKITGCIGYVNDIDHKGNKVNLVKYRETEKQKKQERNSSLRMPRISKSPKRMTGRL